ncbi:MAG: hypothetical protein AAF171_18320 [Cyanobacteria bacterium P01_A01_bin.116]
MSTSSSSSQTSNPFGKILSLLTLFAAALYFAGWIYRWSYYDFFQVEVTTLNLPFESFYLAAFQVLFGHPVIIFRTISVAFVTIVFICIALSLWKQITHWIYQTWWKPRLSETSELSQFVANLAEEVIIVLLIVTMLFWTARWQANIDAWRDAVNETSSLPVVTIAISDKVAALGRDVDNPLLNPSGFRIIGDRKIYNQLLGKELNDTEDPEVIRVWRLLVDRNGVLYIFPALPTRDRSLRFPVLIVYESSSQLTILSPQVAE